MLLWQYYHNILSHMKNIQHGKKKKTVKTKPLPLVLFRVKIPSTQAWSNMESPKPWVYLLLTGLFVSIHNPMQVQLGQWSWNHWAIHHRCLQLFGKLAAILALGTNRLARAKMAPCKSHITKEFLHFSLSSCQHHHRATYLFYPPKSLCNLYLV